MPTVSQMQHPLSLDFNNQRKAYMLRTHEKLSYAEIAKQVVNLKGMASTANCVRRAVKKFNTKKGMAVYKYARSGRKAWKLTPDVRAWIVQRLLKLLRAVLQGHKAATLQRAGNASSRGSPRRSANSECSS